MRLFLSPYSKTPPPSVLPNRVKETVWLCLMWPVTLEAVQLSPIGSEQKTINRHQLIPQRWHCSHNLGSTASSTRILLLWDQTCSKSIPACIKEIKCKGAYWQCNYKQATSKEKEKEKKKDTTSSTACISMIGHCSSSMRLLFDPPRNLPKWCASK